MLVPLLLGSLILVINMAIQVAAVVLMLRLILRKIGDGQRGPGYSGDAAILMAVPLVLFAGHLVQIGVWALLFVELGQFGEYAAAYYHSTVNFAALGYGDIVMSERWRQLGALEAASGVLMFGLSASTLFTVMSLLFQWRGKRRLKGGGNG